MKESHAERNSSIALYRTKKKARLTARYYRADEFEDKARLALAIDRLDATDEEVAAWITTKNGVHVPLDDGGNAISDTMEGKYFGHAKTTSGKLEYASDVTPEQRARVESFLARIPRAQLELAETVIKKVNISNSFKTSHYNADTHEIDLSTSSGRDSIIHEYGHALADALDLDNNPEFQKILNAGLDLDDQSKVVYYEDTINEEPVFVLENDKFVDVYQGRLYEDNADGIFERGTMRINAKMLKEYFSVGYDTYYKNPELLKAKDLALYEFIGGLPK